MLAKMLSPIVRILSSAEDNAKLEALNRSQAIIEFKLDGTIITANQNFLNAMGYRLEEIQAQHHSIFVDKDYAQSNEYRGFWHSLNRGEIQSGEFSRINKAGEIIWIQASYNLLCDGFGKPYKI
ncbi:MAG: PAS domain-containing protein, partial [Pseudomonadota bacterium]